MLNWKDTEESSRLIEGVMRNLLRGTEKTLSISFLMLAGLWIKIQARNFRNTKQLCQQLYRNDQH
jgi:hypothetical protein